MSCKRLRQLLPLLKQNDFTSAEEIAGELSLSSKTVRGMLKDGDNLLRPYGASIVAKHGYGYRLQINDKLLYEKHISDLVDISASTNLPDGSEDRIEYILDRMLDSKGYIKLASLEETLYITRNTLSADIKKLEQLISRYRLNLERKAKYGVRLVGDEVNIRRMMADRLVRRVQYSSDVPGIQLQISRCLQPVLASKGLSMSDIPYQSLVLHIYVAVLRVQQGDSLDGAVSAYHDVLGTHEYDAAESLAAVLRENIGVALNRSEIAYLAVHLTGKQTYKGNIAINSRISSIADEMLDEIQRAFNINLKKDIELKMSLCKHLIALEIRMRYGLRLKNPLLDEVRTNYALAYQMAVQASTVLMRHFGKKTDDNETGYIAFCFGLAIERHKSERAKKNILLVCATGTGSAKLLEYKYRSEFGSQIDRILTCDVTEVQKIDFTDIDYAITTVKIETKIPVPILEVKFFLDEGDRTAIRHALSRNGNALEFYSRDLFIPRLKAANRDEVIRKMSGHIGTVRNLPPDFANAVLRREQLARTEFGNCIAMPHPDTTITDTTFVCVAVLEKSIVWEEKEVQVVFLVSVEKELERDLQSFYNLTSKFLFSEECVRQLIQTRDFDCLIDLLSKFKE